MSKDINLLQPAVKAAWLRAKDGLDKSMVKCALTDAFRSAGEQAALYAQGRQALDVVNDLRGKAGMYKIGPADNTYVVTKCDGINSKSNHQSGRAVDVVPLDSRGYPYWPDAGAAEWLAISAIMKKHGFDWGGDWKSFQDQPHYEFLDKGNP